ncbi:hypothetical protein F4679DRAFT_555476 [Xylaria curta]|nr:hypothetical protein F4679DRAFT_555476 [Xylaria curta]
MLVSAPFRYTLWLLVFPLFLNFLDLSPIDKQFIVEFYLESTSARGLGHSPNSVVTGHSRSAQLQKSKTHVVGSGPSSVTIGVNEYWDLFLEQ